MEIKIIKLTKLRNEEHFQFQTGFYNLVNTIKPETLGIQKPFTLYKPLYTVEQGALDKIVKNSLTDDIAAANTVRETIYIGLKDAISACSKHFTPAINEAGNRILIVLDHYGNITRKNYEAKSAAITDLILELTTNYATDVKTTNVQEWVDQLQIENTNFQTLQDERYTMEANSTQVSMTDARVAIDASYKEIVKLINALILVNGETKYTSFVNELNERIDSFNLLVSRRSGKDEEEENNVEYIDEQNDISNREDI